VEGQAVFSQRCSKVRDDGLTNCEVNAELQQEAMHLIADLDPISHE
jgi:hypothetical protein